MLQLSPKQQELQERDTRILAVARELVLDRGYHGLTMDHIAKASGYPKGTVYHRFTSKEDVVVALGIESLRRRTEMMRRGAAYNGKTRVRMLVVGEAVGLFARLNPEDSRILHAASGPSRENASPERVMALLNEEKQAGAIVGGVLADAVRLGELVVESDIILAEFTLGAWGLVEGGHTLIENGIARYVLGLNDAYHRVWRAFNHLADAYGWKPLFSEWDYEESLALARRAVFPKEAQELYGEGVWYGDRL